MAPGRGGQNVVRGECNPALPGDAAHNSRAGELLRSLRPSAALPLLDNSAEDVPSSRRLASGRSERNLVSRDDSDRLPAAASRLAARRPDAPLDERAAALELVTEGRRLAAKLRIDERLLAVRGAVEQAVPARVATWHAQQIPAGCRVLEIGCGCGSDSLALAHRAANLIATDVDPVRAACTHMNLMAFGLGGARAIPGDGLAILADEGRRADVVVVDPERRRGGTRFLDADSWVPPLSALRAIAGGERGVFVKAPASLDAAVAAPQFDVTYVSYGRACVEAFLAAPAGARTSSAAVRAVLLPEDGPSIVLAGDRGERPAGPLGDALYAVDPAAARARLLAALADRHALSLVSAGTALMTGAAGADSPWLTEHRVIDRLRLLPHDVRVALARLPGGFGGLRVHSRGVALSAPEILRETRRVARTRGAPIIDLFATRTLGAPTAVLTQRV